MYVAVNVLVEEIRRNPTKLLVTDHELLFVDAAAACSKHELSRHR